MSGIDQLSSCNLCRYWAPNLEGEEAEEGICRELVENPAYYDSLITEANDKCDEWARFGVYKDLTGQVVEERRGALRSRINLPARLRTSGGVQSVWLADFSEKGRWHQHEKSADRRNAGNIEVGTI